MNDLEEFSPHWLHSRLEIFLLFLLCLLMYLPSLQHGFVMDDRWLVTENPYIKSWRYFPNMLTQDAWNIWVHHNYWRPIFSLSLALDYSLWSLNPSGFHLTSVLLHAINTLLLYLLGKRLQSRTCGVFAALLFALHPIQSHAVNVVAARSELLAALFTLLSLHAFFSHRLLALAVALALALLSKETSMVFPLALFFAGVTLEGRNWDIRFTLALGLLALYLGTRVALGFSFSVPASVFSYDLSWDARLLLAFKALALYSLALGNIFEMPHPSWSVEIPASAADLYVLGGLFIFGLLLGGISISYKKNPPLAFGLTWFLIYFLPISNLKELNQPMAEHWLYIPMIGLSLAFGVALNAAFVRHLEVRLVRIGITACVAVFLVFGALVVREKTRLYQNDESFLLAAIRANPQVARLYSLLGNVYMEKRNISMAKELYAKALTLDANDLPANYMLGFLLHKAGQHDKAKINLERVARIEPVIRAEFEPVAHAWEMLGDKQRALFYFRKALEVNAQSVWIKEKVVNLESQLLDSRPSISLYP